MAEEHGPVVRVLDELGTTPNGKVLHYVKRENASIRFVAFKDGGQLPEMLQGGFSSVHAARMAVASYIKQLNESAKPKAKAKK